MGFKYLIGIVPGINRLAAGVGRVDQRQRLGKLTIFVLLPAIGGSGLSPGKNGDYNAADHIVCPLFAHNVLAPFHSNGER